MEAVSVRERRLKFSEASLTVGEAWGSASFSELGLREARDQGCVTLSERFQDSKCKIATESPWTWPRSLGLAVYPPWGTAVGSAGLSPALRSSQGCPGTPHPTPNSFPSGWFPLSLGFRRGWTLGKQCPLGVNEGFSVGSNKMLFLYTCVVSRNCVCLGCTTLGGDRIATVDDESPRVLLATCRNDSPCFLCVVEDCTVLFTQKDVIKNF